VQTKGTKLIKMDIVVTLMPDDYNLHNVEKGVASFAVLESI